MDRSFLLDVLLKLLAGLPLTIGLTVLALAGGAMLALALTGLRASGRAGLWVADAYVFVFRGSPLLIQIFMIYYGLPQFGVVRHSVLWPLLREPYVCAALAFMLNDAAYTSEILRGGLRAVPRGAVEAARVGNMGRWTTFRRIVLPLAVRQALPAYGIEITSMLKATSLASVVTLMDVTGIARALVSETYRAIEVFGVAALIYLVLVTATTAGVRALEGRLSIGGGGMTRPVVRLRSIHKHFGPAHVLRGIDLDANTGDVVSVIGSSGSGKSTLLRCIPFLEQPDAGTVTVGGATLRRDGGRKLSRADRAAIRAIRSRVGFVFQNFNLWPHLTALGNVMEVPLQVQKRPRAEVREEAEALLDKVGLSARRDAWPAHLSGGQQQRVAIARALAIRPEALLFDEPTSALDPELVGEVLAVIRSLAEEGRTMILVTHEMTFARHVSTKSIFLHGGLVEEAGSPEQVFGAPLSDRCRRFVAGLATGAAR